MRLSEAIRLGSLAIQNPQQADIHTCAIGMGLTAVNKLHLNESDGTENYNELERQWPWTKTRLCIYLGPTKCFLATHYTSAIWYTFDVMVMDEKTMTLEALCDQVKQWEDELAAKGINVEQVAMIATPEATHEPAAEQSEMVGVTESRDQE